MEALTKYDFFNMRIVLGYLTILIAKFRPIFLSASFFAFGCE